MVLWRHRGGDGETASSESVSSEEHMIKPGRSLKLSWVLVKEEAPRRSFAAFHVWFRMVELMRSFTFCTAALRRCSRDLLGFWFCVLMLWKRWKIMQMIIVDLWLVGEGLFIVWVGDGVLEKIIYSLNLKWGKRFLQIYFILQNSLTFRIDNLYITFI